MNRNDYRNHLDRIRCSAEFRAKMEKRLESEPDGEYEDSVSDIEHAPKINYHRWTALAASALIVIGIGGFVFLSRDDIINTHDGSNITEASGSSSVLTKISPAPSNRYNIEISISGAYSKDEDKMTSIGTVPPELVDRYLNEMKNWSDFELDGIPSISSEPTGVIKLSFTGKDNFTWKIDSNGCTVTKRNNEETSAYYSDMCYLSLLRWIARDMPYFDWTYIIDGDMGTVIDKAFKNHINEIERTDNYDDINGMRFFEAGSFSGTIDENGNFRIYYNNEQNFVSFKSSPEFYEEIQEIINNNLVYMISKSNVMFYVSSTGQTGHSVIFEDINTDNLCSAIESLNWCTSESEYPSGEFFGIGNLMIKTDGSIYNSETGIMYTPTNQYNIKIIDEVNKIIQSNDLEYMNYLVASSDNRFDTMSAKIYYYCKDIIEGNGVLYYDTKNKNEYVHIEDEKGNSAELKMESNLWTSLYNRDGNIETAEDSGLMSLSMIDYVYIKNYLLSTLRDIYHAKDKKSDMVINLLDITKEDDYFRYSAEYIYEKNLTSISAEIDSIGNITHISIQQTDVDTGEVSQDITFHIMDKIVYDDPDSASEYGFD